MNDPSKRPHILVHCPCSRYEYLKKRSGITPIDLMLFENWCEQSVSKNLGFFKDSALMFKKKMMQI